MHYNSHEGESRDTTSLTSEFTPNGLIITNRSFCHNDVVQSFRNSGNQLSGKREHHGENQERPGGRWMTASQ
jgi:hypothetical protein